MIISFSAIFTSIITVTILTTILSLILLINKYGLKLRYEYVLFIIAVIIGRLIIPFEWKWTHTILSRNIMPPIYNFFYQKIYNDIRLIDLFLIVWIVGSILLTIKYFKNMKKLYGLDKNFDNKLDEYKASFPFLNNKKIKGIYKLNNIQEPFVTNPFKPTIYLPNVDYTKEELEFILLHESQHITNRDLYTKILIQILIILYWWFPLIYVLRNIIDYILELRVDYQVTQSFEEKLKNQYLLALITVTQKISETTHIRRYKTLQSQFTLRKESLLKKRINFFYNEASRKKHKLLIIIPAIFLVIALPSIVFQPYTPYKPIKNDQTYGINDLIKQTYIIQTKDVRYYLFDKKTNKKIATIKDIKKEPYNKIKIIKEK